MKNDTKFELEKYISYFDKYINHDKSQKFLRILMVKSLNIKWDFLKKKNTPYLELSFLDDAVVAVIDCIKEYLYFWLLYGYM
jgi:hypothetical protein